MSAVAPDTPRAPENRLTPSPGLCEHCRGLLPLVQAAASRGGSARPGCRRLGWLDRQRAEAVASREADLRVVLERVGRGLNGIIGRLRA